MAQQPLDKKMREELSEKVSAYPKDSQTKFLSYIFSINRFDKKGKNQLHDNNVVDLFNLFMKFYNIGITIDGTNAVIAGKRMAMVTYHGYKNVVLRTYPEAKFDLQLVKEGDEFKVAKESGSVVYSHQLNNPFSNAQIIGAYCVIKTDRGEFFEALTKEDFEQMKKGSKQFYLWNDWESEFWLKSVIKRACKRHFYDVVEKIDKHDNEDFGQETSVPAKTWHERIDEAKTKEELTAIMGEMNAEEKQQAAEYVKKRMGEINANAS